MVPELIASLDAENEIRSQEAKVRGIEQWVASLLPAMRCRHLDGATASSSEKEICAVHSGTCEQTSGGCMDCQQLGCFDSRNCQNEKCAVPFFFKLNLLRISERFFFSFLVWNDFFSTNKISNTDKLKMIVGKRPTLAWRSHRNRKYYCKRVRIRCRCWWWQCIRLPIWMRLTRTLVTSLRVPRNSNKVYSTRQTHIRNTTSYSLRWSKTFRKTNSVQKQIRDDLQIFPGFNSAYRSSHNTHQLFRYHFPYKYFIICHSSFILHASFRILMSS